MGPAYADQFAGSQGRFPSRTSMTQLIHCGGTTTDGIAVTLNSGAWVMS